MAPNPLTNACTIFTLLSFFLLVLFVTPYSINKLSQEPKLAMRLG